MMVHRSVGLGCGVISGGVIRQLPFFLVKKSMLAAVATSRFVKKMGWPAFAFCPARKCTST